MRAWTVSHPNEDRAAHRPVRPLGALGTGRELALSQDASSNAQRQQVGLAMTLPT